MKLICNNNYKWMALNYETAHETYLCHNIIYSGTVVIMDIGALYLIYNTLKLTTSVTYQLIPNQQVH